MIRNGRCWQVGRDRLDGGSNRRLPEPEAWRLRSSGRHSYGGVSVAVPTLSIDFLLEVSHLLVFVSYSVSMIVI